MQDIFPEIYLEMIYDNDTTYRVKNIRKYSRNRNDHFHYQSPPYFWVEHKLQPAEEDWREGFDEYL